ncbi:MAG: hypothetical protein GXO86_07425 [Chlorobi bacterium]|nr:hypothetical protein [Chlorobiota bacterium]
MEYLKGFWTKGKADGTQIIANFIVDLQNNEYLDPALEATWDNMSGHIVITYDVKIDNNIVWDGNPREPKSGEATINFIADDLWTNYTPHLTTIVINYPNIAKSDKELMETGSGGIY